MYPAKWLATIFLLFIPIVFTAQAAWPSSLFDDAFSRHHVVMLLISPSDGRIVAANKAAAKFYGIPVDTLQSMSIKQINALSPDAVKSEMALAKKENRNFFIFKHKLASGELRTVEVSSIPVTYQNETVLFSVIKDISEQREQSDALWHYQNHLEQMVADKTMLLEQQNEKQFWIMAVVICALVFSAVTLLILLYIRRKAQRLLARKKQRLDDIIWSTNVGTWELCMPEQKVRLNAKWAEIIGYSLDELQPLDLKKWRQLCHPEDLKYSDELMDRHYSGDMDHYSCELRMRHKDGHWVWILNRGKVLERNIHGNPTRICGTHMDISGQKALQQQLETLAHYDSLTHLPNRSLFHERADQVLRYSERNQKKFALLFIDLDGFKAVNDNYGHDAGDAVLCEAARRMSGLVRSSDTVARLGGDEFAVILRDIDTLDGVDSVCSNLLATLSVPYELGEKVANLSASIGIACYPENGTNTEELLNNSDDAMYKAKREGKARAEFV